MDHSPGALARVTTFSSGAARSLPIDSRGDARFAIPLEVEAHFCGVRPRCDEMRATERGQEVVQRGLVRQVYDREPEAPLVTVTMEQVIIAHAGVKQMAWCHTRRIVIVIFRSWSRDFEPC